MKAYMKLERRNTGVPVNCVTLSAPPGLVGGSKKVILVFDKFANVVATRELKGSTRDFLEEFPELNNPYNLQLRTTLQEVKKWIEWGIDR